MEFEDRAIGVPDGKAPIFGVFRSSRGKLATFVVKESRKIPEGVLLAYREKITPAEAGKRAAQMLDDYLPTSRTTLDEYEKEHDLVDGRVATYHDREWKHQAIILTIIGKNALALFFTSKANWAKKTRRASNDEMAAANFISSRRTYVSLVLRPLDGFIPTFRMVPELLLSELKEEFNEKDAEIYIP
jgi:hypothetical protein